MTTNKFPIHSRLSPDYKYIVSGSEDGKLHLWETVTGIKQVTTSMSYEIDGPLADVSWCKSYHMIAVAGFGDEFPIVVFMYEKDTDWTLEEYKKFIDDQKYTYKYNIIGKGKNMEQG